MIPRDKKILRRLTRKQRFEIIRLFNTIRLIDRMPVNRETVYDCLLRNHLTMADVIYVLAKYDAVRLDVHYLLRAIMGKLAPTLTPAITPLLPGPLSRTITAVFSEFLGTYSPVYRVGRTIGELVMVYGMDEKQIMQEVKRGGLWLS